MSSLQPATPPLVVAAANSPPTSASEPRPPLLRRLLFWGSIGILALATGYFALTWVLHRRSHSITDDAFVEAHIVNVAPEMVSGRIVRFLVEENDWVEQGQILAEVEPVHYRDQVEQARGKLELAEAELKRQEAGLSKLKKEVPLQIGVARQTLSAAQIDESRAVEALKLTTDEVNATIEEAQAAVAVATANSILARQEYQRWTNLAAQDATTERRAQEVTRAFESSKAERHLADARLAKAEAARTRIVVSKRDLEVVRTLVAKATIALDLAETGYDQIHEVELLVGVKNEMVKDAKIALESADHMLAFTVIRAPLPGVVVKRYRSLGDFVSAGVPIVSMYDTNLLYVTANLEETRLRGVAPGNPVELRLDAFDRPFKGRVVWMNKSTGAQFALMPRNVVSGEFTKVVQRVPVRISIDGDDRKPLLRAGLSARVIVAHGDGDAEWARQTAGNMARVEQQHNRPN